MIFLVRGIRRRFSHTVQPIFEHNQYNRLKQFNELTTTKLNITLDRYFDEKGSNQNVQKYPQINRKRIYGINQNLLITSIGLGTYKGDLSQNFDIVMFNAIVDSLLLGVNHIDTCSNFRAGRSQICIGLALRFVINNFKYSRNNFLISTKAGYLLRQLPKQISSSNVINGHCVHPVFLEQCLNNSLQSMGIQTIDIFYLNNFAQCQMQQLGVDKFQQRLSRAFQFLETARKQKKIRYYGLCSWKSFRIGPKQLTHLNLEKIVKIAQKVGGINHGFKFIQLPINVMMPEAFAQKYQAYGSLLETAEALKINVVSCSPILSGTLINVLLPADKTKCRHNGAKHLQLIRSIPSSALVSTLIGQTQNRHVKKNLEVLGVQTLNEDEWLNIIAPNSSPQNIGE